MGCTILTVIEMPLDMSLCYVSILSGGLPLPSRFPWSHNEVLAWISNNDFFTTDFFFGLNRQMSCIHDILSVLDTLVF